MTTSQLTLRALGRTGLNVTPIGLGGAYLGTHRQGNQHTVVEDTGIETVLSALRLGINLIDTSAGYMGGSRSEMIIGRALDQWFAQGGRREDLVISTKTGTRERQDRGSHSYTASATWQSVDTSLELLKCDYLDAVLVHDPVDLESILAPDGAWEALKEMKAQGMIRTMGLGVRSYAFHQRLIATGDCDVCLTHCDYNLANQCAAEGVLEPAAASGVGVLNGTCLFHGLLLGTRRPDEISAERMRQWGARPSHQLELESGAIRAQRAWDLARKWSVDLLALNLQYIAREPRISATLLGASTPEQIEADVAALHAPIPDTVWAELAAVMETG